METCLIFYLSITCIVIENVASQYGYPQFYQMPAQPSYYPAQPFEPPVYEYKKNNHNSYSKKREYREHKRTKTPSSESEDTENNSGSDSNEIVSKECKCSCQKCENPKPCCKSFCENCNTNQGIMFIPYPYPVMVPEINPGPTQTTINTDSTTVYVSKSTNITENITQATTQQSTERTTEKSATTTTKRTTEKSTTEANTSTIILTPITNSTTIINATLSSTTPTTNGLIIPNVQADLDTKDIIFRSPRKIGNKYIMMSLRRMKENYIPKYGVVPIPNSLALELMKQLRSMKVIHDRRNVIPLDHKNPPPVL